MIKSNQLAGVIVCVIIWALDGEFTGVCWEFHHSWYQQDWEQLPWLFLSFHLLTEDQ